MNKRTKILLGALGFSLIVAGASLYGNFESFSGNFGGRSNTSVSSGAKVNINEMDIYEMSKADAQEVLKSLQSIESNALSDQSKIQSELNASSPNKTEIEALLDKNELRIAESLPKHYYLLQEYGEWKESQKTNAELLLTLILDHQNEEYEALLEEIKELKGEKFKNTIELAELEQEKTALETELTYLYLEVDELDENMYAFNDCSRKVLNSSKTESVKQRSIQACYNNNKYRLEHWHKRRGLSTPRGKKDDETLSDYVSYIENKFISSWQTSYNSNETRKTELQDNEAKTNEITVLNNFLERQIQSKQSQADAMLEGIEAESASDPDAKEAIDDLKSDLERLDSIQDWVEKELDKIKKTQIELTHIQQLSEFLSLPAETESSESGLGTDGRPSISTGTTSETSDADYSLDEIELLQTDSKVVFTVSASGLEGLESTVLAYDIDGKTDQIEFTKLGAGSQELTARLTPEQLNTETLNVKAFVNPAGARTESNASNNEMSKEFTLFVESSESSTEPDGDSSSGTPASNTDTKQGEEEQSEPDYDKDGIPDTADNCPVDSNSSQMDSDGDGLGDACDSTDGNTNSGSNNGANSNSSSPYVDINYNPSDSSSSSSSSGHPFTDVRDHWSEDYVEEAYNKTWVEGVSSTKFAPNDRVNAAAFIKMLMETTGLGTQSGFSDFSVNVPSWFEPYLVSAESADIVRVRDGLIQNFSAPITRCDASLYIARAYNVTKYLEKGDNPFVDVDEDLYCAYAIVALYEQDVVSGFSGNQFRPFDYLTRAEALSLMLNARDQL